MKINVRLNLTLKSVEKEFFFFAIIFLLFFILSALAKFEEFLTKKNCKYEINYSCVYNLCNFSIQYCADCKAFVIPFIGVGGGACHFWGKRNIVCFFFLYY